LTILTANDEKKAIEETKKGRYKAALLIPEDYSKKVAIKAGPEVGLFLDNTDGISTETIRNIVQGALQATQSDYVPVREKKGEVLLRDINLYRKVDYNQSLVPGVVIMAIFLGTLTTGAFNLVMDRFLGVDESYLLTPLTKLDMVAGLVVSGLSITMLIAVVILTVSMIITGISFSATPTNLASLLVILLLTTTSLLSLMFVLLGRLRHPRVVGIISGFMNVILFFPAERCIPSRAFHCG